MAAKHTINEYEEEDNKESLHTIISNIIGSMEDKESTLEIIQEETEDEEEIDFVGVKSENSDTKTEVQLTSKQIKKQDILENLEDFDESSDEEETSSEEAEEPDAKTFIPTYSEFTKGSKTHLFIDLQDPGNEEAFSHFPVFPTWYDDVGCEKYIDLAKTMKIPAIRRFYESLHTSTVNLEYYGMEGSQIKAMTDALTENTKVRQLKFGNNPLNTDAMYHIASLLRDSLFIKKLNLNSCMLTAESVARLSEGLELTQYLQELDLSHNNFKDIGLEMLSKGMQLNTSITKLNLSHNDLTHKSGFILAEIFEENVTLTHIDLSWNDINKEQGLKNFMSVTAAQNETLTHLKMAWNGLTGEKISRCFKPLLEKHKALKMLDLSNNRFEEASALTVFAKSLSKSQTLEEFHLSGNPINSESSLALLSNILPQAKLQHLMLSNIWVTQEFNKLQKQLEASQNLKVHFEGVYGDYKIIGPNMQEILLKRANYLGYKMKKKKRKDFGWFLLRLQEAGELKPVKKKKFIDLVTEDKIRFDDGLIDEMAKRFRNKKKLIDLPLMLELYMKLFPLTVLPKKKKKKASKKQSSVRQSEVKQSASQQLEPNALAETTADYIIGDALQNSEAKTDQYTTAMEVKSKLSNTEILKMD